FSFWILKFVFTTDRELLNRGAAGTEGFGAIFDVGVNVGPAGFHAGTVLVENEAESGVAEFDERAAVGFRKTVLDVVGDGIGHEERAGKFDQRGALDGLHCGPDRGTSGHRAKAPASWAWACRRGVRCRGRVGRGGRRTERQGGLVHESPRLRCE